MFQQRLLGAGNHRVTSITPSHCGIPDNEAADVALKQHILALSSLNPILQD